MTQNPSHTVRPGSIRDRIFCAIDTPDIDRARAMAKSLSGAIGGIKLGLEFFTANGPDGVRRVMDEAPDAALFLDLKFHDIPNTVAAAMRSAAVLGPAIINVHGFGGRAMLEAAYKGAEEGAADAGHPRPKVIAVTVLTSLDQTDLEAMNIAGTVEDQVEALARTIAACGLDGVVCSALEIASLRAALGPDFILVTPGIRPKGADIGDQKRIMTPTDAIKAGSDYLVIGRPITAAPDPAAAAQKIVEDIENGDHAQS
ncbi:MAG: orotidine-5'-phosphate decarboxylase [Rhodospirillales bacterium]|jgi:orotidine-5'-phosphate decarboxylase|nr:orotidine-5'-phosphate decarboxylase [Rhodospirillales bacterium]MBT5075589.1 orotidine-5'-phosphate decarboxylase [Rhodospirillales bacterium]MBT5114129.1 orotidine-5'-phosphate decarboxylase [Rhodospirillales bacterium]MBT5672657.1 orotidine-5'-phosphate decarboxylase [Rhodospirillales bacterium]MBT6185673.1 orotidine-5'-phosphate decarboxylase [Rhodospirillales bacterium]